MPILFHVKPSQNECSARNKQDLGTYTYCEDLNASAIRARPLLVTHRVDQVDAPHHRFTHRSYGSTGSELTECSERFLLVGIHSSFNVGRALEGSLQLCRLPHASTPRESSPARQRLTLRKAVSRETKPFSSHRTIRRTGQDGRHSHHPSALPQGRGSATHCLRT